MGYEGSMAPGRIREEAQLINGKLTREHELKCMQLDRTAALVARLKEHLAKTQTSQVALSRTLGLSPQNTSLILRGTNCPNSETTLQIALEILRTNNQMDDKPKTLHLAKERISEQAEEIKQLKSLMAKAAAPAVPPPTLPKPTPEPQAIHPPPAPKPAVQLPAPSAIPPTTTGRAKSAFANLSNDDLLANLKTARGAGYNADHVRQLLAEVEARGVDLKPALKFPTTATTPAQIRAVFDNTSMDGLREMLQTEGNSPLKMTIFREIKRCEKEGLK
jgi:hypothetical protein